METTQAARRFSPRRPLGRTGFVVTALGIGDVADRSVPLRDCAATVRRALDAGLNVIDTAPGGGMEQLAACKRRGLCRFRRSGPDRGGGASTLVGGGVRAIHTIPGS